MTAAGDPDRRRLASAGEATLAKCSTLFSCSSQLTQITGGAPVTMRTNPSNRAPGQHLAEEVMRAGTEQQVNIERMLYAHAVGSQQNDPP
jgi:hypothetical protein